MTDAAALRMLRYLASLDNAGSLTLREALMMLHVASADSPPTVGEIAVAMTIPQPSASRGLQRLERMGLLLRADGGGRGRRQQFWPTRSAHAALIACRSLEKSP